MKERTVTCEMCGNEFTTTATRVKYCSECASAAEIVQTKKRSAEARQRNAIQKAEQSRPQKPSLGAPEISKLAKEAKMTYGQYVAAMRM